MEHDTEDDVWMPDRPRTWAVEVLKAMAERDAYREALAVIARDIAEDGSVTQAQIDAAYALARECVGGRS